MIVLQFSTESGLAADIVRMFDHGWCTHVDAVMPNGDLLGARYAGGVQIRPPNYVHFTQAVTVSLPFLNDFSFYEYLVEQVGKPYDSEAILAFAIDRDWREDDSWFCSELITAGLEHCGYFNHKLVSPNNKITPSDLMQILSVLVDMPE